MHFHSALATFEAEFYVVARIVWTENIHSAGQRAACFVTSVDKIWSKWESVAFNFKIA